MRWRDHGLPQVFVFKVGGRVEVEDFDSLWNMAVMQVDILASGRDQRLKLAGQVNKALYTRENRESLARSGVKMDRKIIDVDAPEDGMLPQDVFRRQMTFKVYYENSGA